MMPSLYSCLNLPVIYNWLKGRYEWHYIPECIEIMGTVQYVYQVVLVQFEARIDVNDIYSRLNCHFRPAMNFNSINAKQNLKRVKLNNRSGCSLY